MVAFQLNDYLAYLEIFRQTAVNLIDFSAVGNISTTLEGIISGLGEYGNIPKFVLVRDSIDFIPGPEQTLQPQLTDLRPNFSGGPTIVNLQTGVATGVRITFYG
jgi:hypothetical protein